MKNRYLFIGINDIGTNMAITDSWLKANHKKERSKTIVKTDRDGLSTNVSPKGKTFASAGA